MTEAGSSESCQLKVAGCGVVNGCRKLTELQELENVCYKYKRLESLISILQVFVAECIEITDVPADSLSNALYEVELGLAANNTELERLFRQLKGGAA